MLGRGILMISMLGSPVAFGAVPVITTGKDEEARLPYWQVQQRGVSIRLVQRLPDQTRAFFQARGFSPQDAETIAQSCVFQTVFKNRSHETEPSALAYDLNEWHVITRGKTQKMKTRERWEPEWQARKVPEPAQIAFKWALFPTQQRYNPGDYNWGMSIFDLPPGTRFDLRVSWRQYEKTHTALIRDIECAPDIHLEPGSL